MEPLTTQPDDDEKLFRFCEEVLRPDFQRLNARWWRFPLLPLYYHCFADALMWLDEAQEVPWRTP